MDTRVAGAVSGALAALALPPFSLWPLAFAALIPLGVALSRHGLGRRDTVAGGLWFGGVFYGIVLHWVPATLSGMIPLGALLGVLSIVLLAATGGVQGVVLHDLLVGRRSSPILAIPAVWVSVEVLLASAGPLAIPWTPLGLSLASVPQLAGPAEWVGVRGLTLWIALVNGGFVAGVLAVPRRRLGIAVATLGAGLVPAVAGFLRDGRLTVNELPTVHAAQMNVSRDALVSPDVRDQRASESLTRLLSSPTALSESATTDRSQGSVVVILPEAPFRELWRRPLEERMVAMAEELGMPLLVGAHVPEAAFEGTDPGPPRNAVLLVHPDGSARIVHVKVRLVPGVERPGLRSGPGGGVLRIGDLRMALAICFESAFGGDIRRLRREGAELLVNPTNDGWFRPRLSGTETAAHAQHRAHLILRSVENRMGSVRSSLGGELLAIGPDGRVATLRPVGAESLIPMRVSTSTTMTAYTRYGDLVGLACLLLLLLLVVPGSLAGRGRPR